MGKTQVRVIQPNQIARMHGIEDTKDFRRVLASAFNVLMYLKPGDRLETGSAAFEKLDTDLIRVEADVDLKQLVDNLEDRRVVRIPV